MLFPAGRNDYHRVVVLYWPLKSVFIYYCFSCANFFLFIFFRNNGNRSPDANGDNEADKKRVRRPYNAKTFKVEISFATKVPMYAIANALRGQETENFQEAVRVLDIILRQHAAKQ